MAVTVNWYGAGLRQALSGGLDLDSDTFRVSLHTDSYAPDRAAHEFHDDLTGEVSGDGYTTGGATAGSPAVAFTAANSWGTSRANTTAYVAGQYVRPATGNTYVYQALTSGTTAGSPPTYPTTIGGTVSDGTVTWLCVGIGVLTFDFSDVAWVESTIADARYAVVCKWTGSSGTSPLLGLIDFGADLSTNDGTIAIQLDSAGLLAIAVP